MSNAPRPRPTQRCSDGLQRLRHNTDFVAFREHLEADLAYWKDALVNQTDATAFGQVQGRARELQDLLQHLNPKE